MSRYPRQDKIPIQSASRPMGVTAQPLRELPVHSYKFAGDKDGNGMFVLYADSEDDLWDKICRKRAGIVEKFNGTVCPDSPRVIERQAAYLLDGEPQR